MGTAFRGIFPIFLISLVSFLFLATPEFLSENSVNPGGCLSVQGSPENFPGQRYLYFSEAFPLCGYPFPFCLLLQEVG